MNENPASSPGRFHFVKSIFIWGGILAWAIFVVLEYLYQHPWYPDAFGFFHYYDLALIFLGLTGLFSFLLGREKYRSRIKKYINGLSILGFSWIFILICKLSFFSKFENLSIDASGVFHFALLYFGVAFACWLVIGTCYVAGDKIWQWFPAKGKGLESGLLKICAGMIFVVLLLFFLGSVHLLYSVSLILILVGISALNYKAWKSYVMASLLQPLKLPKTLNTIGVFSFMILLVFTAMNFTQILRPIPLGFDASTLYVRLPELIDSYHGLVKGHGFYYWGLFMSIGNVGFRHLEVVLGLSFVGGMLSLLGLFALARKLMTTNHALLSLAAFYTLPMVTFHSSRDMKVDLGLLFFSVCLVLLLVNWKEMKPIEQQSLKHNAVGFRLLVWMGVLAGFCLGIKLTALFILFALLAGIWYSPKHLIGFIGLICLLFFGVLFLQLDKQADLRAFHAGVGIFQWVLAILGVSLLTWEGIKAWKSLVQKLKWTVLIIGSFTLLTLPWIGKNLLETRQLSVNAILNGKKALPEISIQTLEANYEKGRNQ